MKAELAQVAKSTREFLCQNREKLKLPFLFMFPVNCCEIASLVLGKVFVDAFQGVEVVIVKAQNDSGERHLWLEVDGDVYDITADQFDGVDIPIFGGVVNPLEDQYDVYEVASIREELERNSFGMHVSTFSIISKRILAGRVDKGEALSNAARFTAFKD